MKTEFELQDQSEFHTFPTVVLGAFPCYFPGIFTDTVNGTYQFTVNIRGNRKFGPIYIKNNGDIVCQS